MFRLGERSWWLSGSVVLMFTVAGDVRAQTTFVDFSTKAGVTGSISRGGAAWGDFNGDGRPDVLVGSHFFAKPTLFQNLGDGRFKDVTTTVMKKPTNLAKCVVPGEPVGPWGDHHGRAWADFDNDGDLDLIQLVGAMKGLGCGPNQLYVNGGGRLVDYAINWGIDYQYSRARSPVWLDYDNDGRLDLYQTAYARPDGQAPPTLLRGTPADLSDARKETGFQPLNNTTAFAGDFLGGGAMELLVHGKFAVPLRRGPGAVPFTATSLRFIDVSSSPFTDVTPIAIPLSDSYHVDAALGYVDGDLRQDIFIANEWTSTTSEGHRLFLNRKAGFVDASGCFGDQCLVAF